MSNQADTDVPSNDGTNITLPARSNGTQNTSEGGLFAEALEAAARLSLNSRSRGGETQGVKLMNDCWNANWTANAAGRYDISVHFFVPLARLSLDQRGLATESQESKDFEMGVQSIKGNTASGHENQASALSDLCRGVLSTLPSEVDGRAA